MCPENYTCSLKAESCTQCASTTCVQIGSLPGQAPQQKSTPVGAIAGGVVGGIAAICVLTYLVYRFCIKRRRRESQAWMDQPVEKRDQATLARNRQSTRSAHSIASTVLTRASNVIQIAYIPGVTGRTPPDSPVGLIPPVPSLPFGSATTSAASTPGLQQDMHFFMPSDLRDSTYSDMTADQRMSIAPSLARASVATTIYRNAVVSPVPAQQAFLHRPAVVSVKSGATTGSNESPSHPPVPQVPHNMTGSSIVARNLTARPIEVRKPSSGSKVPTLGNLARAADAKRGSVKSDDTSSSKFSDEKQVVVTPASPTASTPRPTTSSFDSPIIKQQASYMSFGSTTASSSMSGPPVHPSSVLASSTPLQDISNRNTQASSNRTTQDLDLNSRIENAFMNAARDPTHMLSGHASHLRNDSRPETLRTDSGPFSDSHELKENLL